MRKLKSIIRKLKSIVREKPDSPADQCESKRGYFCPVSISYHNKAVSGIYGGDFIYALINC